MLRWYADNGETSRRRRTTGRCTTSRATTIRDYDALYDQATKETDPSQGGRDLFIQMNDLLINDVVVIPIVQRASEKYAASAKPLNQDNIAGSAFEVALLEHRQLEPRQLAPSSPTPSPARREKGSAEENERPAVDARRFGALLTPSNIPTVSS